MDRRNQKPPCGGWLEAPIGVRFPPHGWLRTALVAGDATSSGAPDGAYLRAIRDFDSDRRMDRGNTKPPCGGWLEAPIGVEPMHTGFAVL